MPASMQKTSLLHISLTFLCHSWQSIFLLWNEALSLFRWRCIWLLISWFICHFSIKLNQELNQSLIFFAILVFYSITAEWQNIFPTVSWGYGSFWGLVACLITLFWFICNCFVKWDTPRTQQRSTVLPFFVYAIYCCNCKRNPMQLTVAF